MHATVFVIRRVDMCMRRRHARWRDHFECLWDLFRSIPSLEVPGASVLDEYYWLNKHDPNYSLCRATVNRGEDAHTDGKIQLEPERLHGDHEAVLHEGRGSL